MTAWTYDPDDAVARARAPRVPSSHLRPGRVPERGPQCQYGAGTKSPCREVATATITTRTVHKEYCDHHHALVLHDIQARQPKRISEQEPA